ncbi:MAG: hypothetical protein NC111_00190 [Bacteroides sp.]|nr:hypothetical protein [Bacteroides sp.]MCM1412771.1 hypothetical protein [Bacteroides sp.]MCM1470935.1 hypothetical protein [Bacteroides sp.]
MLHRFKYIALSLAAALTVVACEHVDNHRIPPVNVNLNFTTIGNWHTYGVTPGTTARFIRDMGIPSGYPYTVAEATGFGGLLLVCDPNGDYFAYDLACPVECKQDIRVEDYSEGPIAGLVRCPKCHSIYNVYSGGGPYSGEAVKLNYGLEPYRLLVGSQMPPYAYVRR